MPLPLPFSYFQKVGIHRDALQPVGFSGAHVIFDSCRAPPVTFGTFLTVSLLHLLPHRALFLAFSF